MPKRCGSEYRQAEALSQVRSVTTGSVGAAGAMRRCCGGELTYKRQHGYCHKHTATPHGERLDCRRKCAVPLVSQPTTVTEDY